MSNVNRISSEDSLNWDDVSFDEFVWDGSEVQMDVFEMSKYSTVRISSYAALARIVSLVRYMASGR
jgi:hypothetical protein